MNEEQANEGQPSQKRWKKTSVVTVLLVVAAIAGLSYLVLPPKEPAYNGKPLSYWLARNEEFGPISADSKDPKAIECRAAIRHIGTNAIPFLVRMLRAKDSALKMKLISLLEWQDYVNFHFSLAEYQYSRAMRGFFCLDDLAIGSVPALVDIYKNSTSPSSKQCADSVLKAIYPASGTAAPYWVPLQERAEWYYDAGATKSQLGAPSNAILAYSEAIKLNPTNASAYLDRGSAKMQLQDYVDALGDVERAIGLNSSNQSAFSTRGVCKFALKDFKSADADFTTAINMYTNDISAYNCRGLVRANLRRMDDALADFNRAVELSPQEPTFYRNRAMVESLQKEYELALEDASKAIRLDGKDALVYVTRGHIKNSLKDYKAALQDFEKAVELTPQDSAAYSSRGAAKMLMDDFDGASADLEKALQLNPKNVSAFVVRGYLKVKRGGEDDGALADLERAVELGPQSPETHTVLGLFQYQISQRAAALENCRKATELGALASTADLKAYIWLIRAQKGEEAEANRELETYLKSLQGAKTKEWEASIARFLSGSLTESNFLGQATTTAKRPSAVRGQVCESFYYAGMKRKLSGDKQGALEFFQKCLDTKNDNSFGYLNAGVEMRAFKNN